MKKLATNLVLSSLILTTAAVSSAFAQDGLVAKGAAPKASEVGISADPESPAASPSGTAIAFLDNKLQRKFKQAFPEAKDAVWYRDGKMTRFYFHGDGTIVRSAMNDKGEIAFVIRYYQAAMLPLQVSNAIRENFAGYRQTQVTEVSLADKTAFIVKLEGIDDWLQVKYLDGEITPYARFTY
jgi:hypothetical protein